jgi:hypothetical protein
MFIKIQEKLIRLNCIQDVSSVKHNQAGNLFYFIISSYNRIDYVISIKYDTLYYWWEKKKETLNKEQKEYYKERKLELYQSYVTATEAECKALFKNLEKAIGDSNIKLVTADMH